MGAGLLTPDSAAVNAGQDITSVPLAGWPSARYTTSCTLLCC